MCCLHRNSFIRKVKFICYGTNFFSVIISQQKMTLYLTSQFKNFVVINLIMVI